MDAYHVYLSIARALGYDLYGQISEKMRLSESLYAALLYPQQQESINRLWRRRSASLSLCQKRDFKEICRDLKTASDRVLDEIDWNEYHLAGLSICFSQLTSSLYFIHQIKKRAPSLKIVVGGSSCAAEMGHSLLKAFPEIDFAVSGEGELPLVHLIKWLSRSGGHGKPHPIQGLLTRNDDSATSTGGFSQVPHLDQLPLPDYSDYFAHLKLLGPPEVFLPKLPMEISRGCWWRKDACSGSYKGCAFCNLNIQWKGYRARSQERVIADLKNLTEKYQALSISFMDNLLPAGKLDELFSRVARLGKDFHLFAEIRATTSRDELAAMGNAGMREVQVGIEALSSSLLKKLNKGTRAIENIEIMKNCEAKGLPYLTGNIILNFPGSEQVDVDETLTNLEFAIPFSPLKSIPFWLGYASPVWQDPTAFGITRVHNNIFYTHLFPPEALSLLMLMIQGYYGGLRKQQRLWCSVKQRIEEWNNIYARLHKAPKSDPILSYQDGGDFLIVRERRDEADDMTHRLKGTSRKIYLL